MSDKKNSEALLVVQPDLLSEDELIKRIQSRCCRIENLGLMSKEGLVGLFRRVVLPLPQRFYRANRRGKMLTSRRAEAGLESRRKEEGSSQGESGPGDRLKPPPDLSKSHKIRISLDKRSKKNYSSSEDPVKAETKDGNKKSPAKGKITLKRPSDVEKPPGEPAPQTESKRQRIAIKWP